MTEAEIFAEITTSKPYMDDMGFYQVVETVDPVKLASFLEKHLPLENK